MPQFFNACRARIGRLSLTLCLCLVATMAQAIAKPPFDHRDYRHVVLDNGLEATLVSDNKARQAAFALEVAVGSFADPEALGGLAHLIEHALLLGDSSQPDGRLREFIARHRGKQNGQTSYEFTRYQVSLDAEALPEALARFGHLLETPRFDAAALRNEVRVVDEEFALVKRKTLWRYRQALKVITEDDHPFRKFAPGSNASLGHVSAAKLHAAATKFMEAHYTPERMRIVVVSNQSLDQLEPLVRSAFAKLRRSDRTHSEASPLLSSARLPARIDIRTTGEGPTLNILFPLPADPDLGQYKPVEYLRYVLEHQGPSSLQKLLKEQGDIHQLSLSPGLDLGGQHTLSLALALTAQGAANPESVLQKVFAALATVRERAVDPELYESFRNLLAVQEFMPYKGSASDFANDLLRQQRDYPVADIRRGEFSTPPFNAERLHTTLAAVVPNNALIILAHAKAKTDQVSPEFGTEYGLHRISPAQVAQWRALEPMTELALASIATALPQDLRVQRQDNAAKPVLAYETERVQLWHAFNRMGDTPRALLYVAIDSPYFGDSAPHRAAGELWLEALQKRLIPLQQRATRSGQSLEIYSHARGLTLKVNAFRDRVQVLTREALDAIARPLDAAEYASAKRALVRRLASPKHKYAFEPLVDEVKDILMHSLWPAADMQRAIDAQSREEFAQFRDRLWRHSRLVAMSFGQVDQKELDALHLTLNQAAPPTPEPTGATSVPLQLPEPSFVPVTQLGLGERRLLQRPLGGKDNALLFYHQGQAHNLQEQAMLELLTPLLRDAYFEEVRGRQQLAYGVLVVPVTLLDTPGLSFIVQSSRTDPAHLTDVTEQFLDGFGAYLRGLNHSVLQRLQASLVKDLVFESTPAEELAGYFWREIGGQADFDQRAKLAEAIEKVRLDDLAEYVEMRLAGQQQRSLILQGWSAQSWPSQANRAPTAPGDAQPAVAQLATPVATSPQTDTPISVSSVPGLAGKAPADQAHTARIEVPAPPTAETLPTQKTL